MNNNKYEKNRTVAVQLETLVLPIDPSNNATLMNAFFSNNLYSNIVDIDENNNYNLELASKYWFDNIQKKIFFEFKNSRVESKDAEFTLRRMIVQNKQFHADLYGIICNPNKSRDECSRQIYVEGELLVIKFDDVNNARDILPILASVDYKIIPISAFDSKNYYNAQISDYTKTSGYYYMQKIGKKFFFLKNSNVKRQDIYNSWELIDFNPRLSNGETDNSMLDRLDIISTTIFLREKEYDNLMKRKWTLFSSHNIRLSMLVFSKDAVAKSSAEERFSVASRISKYIKPIITSANSEDTIEFFQDFSQGFLTNKQSNEISKLRQNQSRLTKNIFYFGVKHPDNIKELAEKNRDIKIIKKDQFNFKENVDIRHDINDISFDVSLSVLSYAQHAGYLMLKKVELDKLAKLRTEAERLSFINRIHFETLKKCLIYPMQVSQYVTAFNGDYTHNLSKFNSRTLLWKIH